MRARRTVSVLITATAATHAFQLPRPALRPTRRRAADDDDDFDFEAAFKERVAEVQSIDVVEAVFGEEGPVPLDLEKMAALGKEALGPLGKPRDEQAAALSEGGWRAAVFPFETSVVKEFITRNVARATQAQ